MKLPEILHENDVFSNFIYNKLLNDLCVKFLANIYQFMLIPYSNLICLKSFKKNFEGTFSFVK